MFCFIHSLFFSFGYHLLTHGLQTRKKIQMKCFCLFVFYDHIIQIQKAGPNYCIGSKLASCINLQPDIKTALLMDLSGTLELTWGNGYKVFKR